jgi:hypothetical protein
MYAKQIFDDAKFPTYSHATMPVVNIFQSSWFVIKAKTYVASFPEFLKRLVSKTL